MADEPKLWIHYKDIAYERLLALVASFPTYVYPGLSRTVDGNNILPAGTIYFRDDEGRALV